MKSAKARKSAGGEEEALFRILRMRFADNMHRHPGIEWSKVLARLEAAPTKVRALQEMERTGGEPDVVSRDKASGAYVFFDCSPQSPEGRTSLCYDQAALVARKKFPPKDSAMNLAAAMGVELLTEEQYQELQRLGEFDTKSSSWLKTPPAMRNLGGAIFGDRRFGRVFVYHNGADAYYAGRGFRACVSV